MQARRVLRPVHLETVSLPPPTRVTLHPYGFYVVPTDLVVDDIPIRFHVWLKGIRRPQEPVWPPHCHRSTMTSHVLHGRLANVTWPNVLIGFGQPLYYVQIEATRSFMIRTPVELTLGEPRREVVEAGHSYVVPKGIIHDTQVAEDEECITLCLFHTDRSGKSLVVGDPEAAERFEMNRLNLSQQEAERAHALCARVLERHRQPSTSAPAQKKRRTPVATGRGSQRKPRA